ncbi:MAG: beta-L-arabinofuranosidase domain-containing protein [Polyangiaceae bacterium]
MQPRLAAAADPVEKLQDFPLDQVQITDEYQKNLFAKDVTYLITTLDSDRLLAGFKAVSTGTTPTNLYGGWESQNIRGHSLGHWLSAVAHAYQQAKGSDPVLASQIKVKLDDVVSKLKTYQLSSGFLFATPMSQFDDMDSGGSNNWVPYYTLHKILAGLMDVYEFEQNPDALAVASKLGDWLYTRASGWSASAKSRVLSSEYGGMNDALYELYKYTKSANHLTVAHIFDDTSLFTTTAAGTDSLNGRHANMTIPKFIGALNRYRTLGTAEASYLTAADQFMALVLKNHTYVTGGNSEDEHFHEPGKLDAHRDNLNNETCNAYNMSKLARDLFKVTGDVKYADTYERIHINEILSSMNPVTGMTTYFKPMGTGYFKAFGTPDSSFWCCTGTGMENFSKLDDSLYFHDATDLYVVGYLSSILNWSDRGLSLTQATDLPLTNKVTVTINQAPVDAVNIKFRKPYWLASCGAATIAVNSQSVNAVDANGFFSVSRVWHMGDKVELTFPMDVQASRLPDNPNAVAFTYGPVVLSAGLGTASMTTTGHAWTIAATKPSGIQDTIAINAGTTINGWLANINTNLIQTPGKLEFNLKNTDSDAKLLFIPHFSRYQDRYGIYFALSGTAGTAVTAPPCPASGGSDSGGGSGGAMAGNGTAGGDTGGAATAGGGDAGGAAAVGGTVGGTPGLAGGTPGLGGASTGAAGNAVAGGPIAMGGAAAVGAGGVGTAGTGSAGSASSGGCSCGLAKGQTNRPWSLAALVALGLVARRRRAGGVSRAAC